MLSNCSLQGRSAGCKSCLPSLSQPDGRLSNAALPRRSPHGARIFDDSDALTDQRRIRGANFADADIVLEASAAM